MLTLALLTAIWTAQHAICSLAHSALTQWIPFGASPWPRNLATLRGEAQLQVSPLEFRSSASIATLRAAQATAAPRLHASPQSCPPTVGQSATGQPACSGSILPDVALPPSGGQLADSGVCGDCPTRNSHCPSPRLDVLLLPAVGQSSSHRDQPWVRRCGWAGSSDRGR